jgi:hypothetical protein
VLFFEVLAIGGICWALHPKAKKLLVSIGSRLIGFLGSWPIAWLLSISHNSSR